MVFNKPKEKNKKVNEINFENYDFRHSHEENDKPKVGEFQSKLFLNDIEKVMLDKKESELVLEKNKRREFFGSELREVKQVDKTLISTLVEAINTGKQIIPRKPAFDEHMTAEVYNMIETEAFNEWRKQLESFDSNLGQLRITRYEHNLKVWRQFWNVIDKSNVLCQIVDCRSPLSYICDDIIKICEEQSKKHILVLNKADFLNGKQITKWREYFDSNNIKFFIWSNRNEKNDIHKFIEMVKECLQEQFEDAHLNIGFIGYPNVGKSSTINHLCGKKVASVARTPGHTKVLQSIIALPDVTFYDCPGLYIPKFFTNEANMALMGLYHVEQLSDLKPIILRILQLIPINELKKQLNISNLHKYSTKYEILVNSYGNKMKYFLRMNKVDEQKTAKKISNLFVDGKILYCSPPPGTESYEFNDFIEDDESELFKVDINEMVDKIIPPHTSRNKHEINDKKYKMQRIKNIKKFENKKFICNDPTH